MSFSQVLLKRLAVLAVAAHSGGSESTLDVGDELSTIQPDVFTTLLEPVEIEAFESRSRTRLLRLLALDQRPALRRRLANQLEQYRLPPDPETEALLTGLAHDQSPVVQRTMAIQLGAVLRRWPALDRTQLIADWALSDDPDLRLAIARALCRPFPALGARTAIELLSQDDDPLVRQAARSAAKLRGGVRV